MKIYNKFVESKKEPLNKNDIWFDGSVVKIYKDGSWTTITLTKEATERLIEYANSLYVYVIVDELPESGEDDKIYILRENTEGSSVKLKEYIWDNGWKFVDNFNSITSITPDWNASEGEDGYIKNRTHYGKTQYFLVEGNSFDGGVWMSSTPLVESLGNVVMEYPILFLKVIDMQGDTILDAALEAIDEFSYSIATIKDTSLIFSVHTGAEGEAAFLKISDTAGDIGAVFGRINVEFGTVVKHLNSSFLPSEIARQESVDELREETTALWENLDSGTFPNLTAGDLAGRGESVPASFGFRASGGKSIKDGRAYIKRIKGNSVVWNNMVDTRGYEAGFIIREGIKIQQGHKYLLQRSAANNGLYLIPVVGGSENYEMSLRDGEYAKICISQYTDLIEARVYSESYCGACVISDLTKMFQAGNEPTTIEEFNARVATLGVDLYAYNEGEVIHCNTERIKSVGDNAWDEQWEEGAIDSDGSINSEAYRRTTSYTRVLPNEEYFLACPESAGFGRYAYYDANYTPIKVEITEGYPANKKFTTPSGASYLRITLGSGYGTTYNHDILISLYHSGWKAEKDDQYQPYWQDTLPLPIIRKYFPDGMKKAGSAHDEIRFNKATQKWEMVQRIGEVDMGTLKWGLFQGNFYSSFGAASDIKINSILLCSAYNGISPKGLEYSGEDKAIWSQINASDKTIVVRDTTYTDVETFKAMLQEKQMKLYYELAEPIVTELDAEDQNFRDYYNVADFGTEMSQSKEPSAAFSADIIYQFNAVDMIREHEAEINELQSVIATMQAQLASLINNQ